MNSIAHFLTGIFLFTLGLGLYSQPLEHKGYLGISGGASLPVGSYVSTNIEDDQPGFALPGFSGQVSTNINIMEYIGFAGMLGYHNNAYNESAFVDAYRASHPDDDFQFSSGNYNLMNLLGGVFVSVPQGILDIHLKGFVGISVCTLPSSRSTSSPGVQGDPVRVLEFQKNRSTTLAYGGGLTLLIFTNTSLSFLVDASYIQAIPEFNAVEARIYEDGELTGLTALDVEQKIQFISLTGGVAFTF
jgi:hypothetical protein